MTSPLDLEAISLQWLQQCGPCDFGLVEYGCNCPSGDYRPVMLALVREVEALRERVMEAEAALDGVEEPSECQPDCDCADHRGPRSCGCHVTGAEAREWIRQLEAERDAAIERAEMSGETTLAYERQIEHMRATVGDFLRYHDEHGWGDVHPELGPKWLDPVRRAYRKAGA